MRTDVLPVGVPDGPNGRNKYFATEGRHKYKTTETQAAIGVPQLARLERNWQRRKQLWDQYKQ